MVEDEQVQRRRIVLHPRTAAARRVDRKRTYSNHVRGFSVQHDEIFTLVDRQRRRAVRYYLLIVVPVFAIIGVLVLLPELSDYSVRGIPLPWILLDPIILFSIVLMAWRHDRMSLRDERSWSQDHQEEDR